MVPQSRHNELVQHLKSVMTDINHGA
jgi:hypothetical protein